METHVESAVPEAILPESLLAQRSELAPEQRLQLAVLEDALRSWRSLAALRTRSAVRMRIGLLEWFGSDAADGPFTFASICDELGIQRDAVRAALGFRARRAA